MEVCQITLFVTTLASIKVWLTGYNSSIISFSVRNMPPSNPPQYHPLFTVLWWRLFFSFIFLQIWEDTFPHWQKLSVAKIFTYILHSSQINKWSLDSSNKYNFVNPMIENPLCDYLQHCFIKRHKRDSLFPIEFCLHNVWFYQLRHRLHLCLRENIFGVICTSS